MSKANIDLKGTCGVDTPASSDLEVILESLNDKKLTKSVYRFLNGFLSRLNDLDNLQVHREFYYRQTLSISKEMVQRRTDMPTEVSSRLQNILSVIYRQRLEKTEPKISWTVTPTPISGWPGLPSSFQWPQFSIPPSLQGGLFGGGRQQ